MRRAYPRSRGGTSTFSEPVRSGWGLSPLARGNLLGIGTLTFTGGPIPARAGEPPCVRVVSLLPRAYPRSRGGTPHLGGMAALVLAYPRSRGGTSGKA